MNFISLRSGHGRDRDLYCWWCGAGGDDGTPLAPSRAVETESSFLDEADREIGFVRLFSTAHICPACAAKIAGVADDYIKKGGNAYPAAAPKHTEASPA